MLTVIMPVYNERFTIKEIIRRVCSIEIPKQLIIVDDGSTDGTCEIISSVEKDSSKWLKAYPQNHFLFI